MPNNAVLFFLSVLFWNLSEINERIFSVAAFFPLEKWVLVFIYYNYGAITQVVRDTFLNSHFQLILLIDSEIIPSGSVDTCVEVWRHDEWPLTNDMWKLARDWHQCWMDGKIERKIRVSQYWTWSQKNATHVWPCVLEFQSFFGVRLLFAAVLFTRFWQEMAKTARELPRQGFPVKR